MKDWKKYLTAIFLISLFIFSGISAALPGLFTDAANRCFIEKFISTETGDENKSTEEKNEKEIREVYLNDDSRDSLALYNLSLSRIKIQARNNSYKQAVYFPVPTPPPEIV